MAHQIPSWSGIANPFMWPPPENWRALHLNEFMWRERHRTLRRLAFTNMRDIAAQYPVP